MHSRCQKIAKKLCSLELLLLSTVVRLRRRKLLKDQIEIAMNIEPNIDKLTHIMVLVNDILFLRAINFYKGGLIKLDSINKYIQAI